MHTVPIQNNPIIERIDLRQAKKVSVNAGWREGEELLKFISDVRKYIADLGFDIEVGATHKLRQCAVIIGSIFYRLAVENSSVATAARTAKHFNHKCRAIMEWGGVHCEKEPVLDEHGLHFFSDDDYTLYKLRFSGYAAAA